MLAGSPASAHRGGGPTMAVDYRDPSDEIPEADRLEQEAGLEALPDDGPLAPDDDPAADRSDEADRLEQLTAVPDSDDDYPRG